MHRIGAFLLLLLLTYCSSQSKYTMLVPTHVSKPADCVIEVFRGADPGRAFTKISRIDVHIERTYYIRSNFEDVLPELKKQACESGADAIIDIQERSSNINVSETNIYHVTATGIRYDQ